MDTVDAAFSMARRRRSVESIERHHPLQSNVQATVTRTFVPVKFLKSVCRNTIEERKLRLPSQLVRNFGKEFRGEVATIGFPNGFFMRVRLTECEGKIWIDITKLVKHFHVRDGFILEFTYKGFCNFEVFIFDPSNDYFQIEYPCHNSSSSSSSDKEEDLPRKQCSIQHVDIESGNDDDVDSVEIHDVWSSHVLQKSLSNPNQASSSKKSQPKSSIDGGGRINKSPGPDVPMAEIPVPKRKPYKTRSKAHLVEKEYVDLDDEDDRGSELNKNEETMKNEATGIKQGKSMTSKKFQSLFGKFSNATKRAIDAANKFKHENPSFQVVLRSYNFKLKILLIPSRFSKKYMNKNPEQLTLIASDRTEWIVKIRATPLGYLKFGRGWNYFSRHTSLKEGDVCLFELIRFKTFTLKVWVFAC